MIFEAWTTTQFENSLYKLSAIIYDLMNNLHGNHGWIIQPK